MPKLEKSEVQANHLHCSSFPSPLCRKEKACTSFLTVAECLEQLAFEEVA